jgi:predicted HTH transcriptional regulator
MDYRTLKDLVKQGEGKYLEFKLKTNHPEKIVREIVAFANTNGGQLIVGIGDDRSIQGLKYADEDEYILVRAIEKYCSPIPTYTIERVAITDERDVLVFGIEPSEERPVYVLQEIITNKWETVPTILRPSASYQQNEPIRKAYIRVADKSVQASKEMREILKRQSKTRNFRFEYGDKERKLMQYLEQNPTITVDDFVLVAAIPRKVASKTLILLVLANVLAVQPDETNDRYTRIL